MHYADRYNQLSCIEQDPISIPHQFHRKQDIEIIRQVLNNIPKEDLVFDEDYCGWLLWGEKPLDEWFFEEGYCILNPKELLGYMEDIIEELKK